MNLNQDTAAVSLIPWQQTPPCCTFIPGVDKQVISRARALLAALVGDGEGRLWGHGLGRLSFAPPLGPAGRLRVGAACCCTQGGAHGGRQECLEAVTEMFQMYVFWSLILKFPAPKVQPSPVVAEDSSQKPSPYRASR